MYYNLPQDERGSEEERGGARRSEEEQMRRGGEEPLRALTDAEREQMAAIVRARSERGDLRQRAVALLAVVEGQSCDAAARRAGYAKG
jgi:hypothetical protein